MIRLLLAALLIIAPVLMQGWSGSAEAQTPQTKAATAGSVIEGVRRSVVQKIGARDDAIKIVVVGSVITVTRVNERSPATTHEARTSEASVIAEVVAAAIADQASYAKISAINISYVRRLGTSVDTRVFDRLRFRRSGAGVFEIHRT